MKKLIFVLLMLASAGISFAQAVGGNGVPGANSTNATALQGIPVSATLPTLNYVLTYNGTSWIGEVVPSAPVSSVFTRTGAVVATTGDYTAAQVGADASGAAATAQSNAESYAVTAIPANTTPFTGSQTAPDFFPQTVTAGPYVNFREEFLYLPVTTATTVGSPTADACGISNTNISANNPGIFQIASGTASSSTGVFCGPNAGEVVTSLNTAPIWTWETNALVTQLPGTHSGSYEVGLIGGTVSTVPSVAGIAFYMSNANANANHWYCAYGTGPTLVDSGVSATANTFQRLSLVNNGTNVLWYIAGAQVCSTAIANVYGGGVYVWSGSSVGATSTSMILNLDYVTFQRAVTR